MPDHPRCGAAASLVDATVGEIMTPGVVSIASDASVMQVFQALRLHRTHAILVVGAGYAGALGWVTARGLLNWVEAEHELAPARDAITERPLFIEPSASLREAVLALSQPETSHLLVGESQHFPEGVVTAFDIARLAGC